MKRYILALVFVVLSLSAADAGQIGGLAGNVGEAGLSLSGGVSYITKDIEKGDVKKEMTARALVVKGEYGLLPNLDIIVKLGFADLKVESFEGRLDALYGAGLKFKLFKDTADKVNVYIDAEVSKFSSSDSGVRADVRDYQVAFIVSNRAGNVTPYGGVKVSDTEVDDGSTKFTASKQVGIVGGADYFVNPNVFFNGEVNIFDEQAVHVGVGYKF